MEETRDNLGYTPTGNTGYMDTLENGLRALVDWVSVSFSDVQNMHDLCAILGLSEDKFEIRDVGYRGYLNSAVFGHIMIAWGSSANTKNMGGFIDMSGQGCREYENHFDLKLNWSEFFALIMNFNHKFSRLDLAIDDFKGYFTIEQAYKCAKKGCLVAQRIQRARSYEDFWLNDGKTHGRTLYIGKSEWQITFYDKTAERDNAGFDVSDYVKFWNRYEIRLRNKIATDAAHLIAYEAYSVGEFIKGFISSKIDFKINNLTDSNKSRWESQRWWKSFLHNSKKLNFTQVAPDPTIVKVGDWLGSQVDTSLATFINAFPNKRLVLEYLTLKGQEKMSKKHENMIADFNKNESLKNNMVEEMENYVMQRRNDLRIEAQNNVYIDKIYLSENEVDKYDLIEYKEMKQKRHSRTTTVSEMP